MIELKVLQIIASMDPKTGGPGQAIRNLDKALGEISIDEEVVSLDNPTDSFLNEDPFVIHALGPSATAWQYSAKLLPWLTDNLGRFDIIVINGIWLYHAYAVRKALRKLKHSKLQFSNSSGKFPKLFIMPHGMLDPYFQNASDRKLKAIRNWFYWLFIERQNIRSANGLLFTCEQELELARLSFKFYKPKKEINIGFGIEVAPPYNEKMKKAFHESCPEISGASYFLFLSRIHNKKGVDILIKAYLKCLESKNTNQDQIFPKLIIAGPGIDTAYGKKIKKLIPNEPAIQSNFIFPGMITGDAKWGAFYGCEAFILPSHQENFGIAIVEALACNKPVLISNKINIWKEILQSGGGLVTDDTEDGAEEILHRWEKLSIREKLIMGNRAKECFQKHFSIATLANRFVDAVHQ